MNVETVLSKDAIPSIDDPEFGESYFGEPDDQMLVLGEKQPRAYPIPILNFHEIVNDVVDGEALAITWCPLCGSAIVYERELGEKRLTFGVSGKLADDDLVMYDRETGSEWKQSSGECIAGRLDGETLTVRPATVLTWETFLQEYPNGLVLQPPHTESEAASDTDDPAPVEYDQNPYEEYFESDGFGLGAHRNGESRSWDRSDLSPKTVVLGIERDGTAIAYPVSRVRNQGGLVTDTVGDTAILVVTAGNEIHAYEDPGYEFERTDDRLRADGTTWNLSTGKSADGRQLTRVPSRRLFAFSWQDDHGVDAFYPE